MGKTNNKKGSSPQPLDQDDNGLKRAKLVMENLLNRINKVSTGIESILNSKDQDVVDYDSIESNVEFLIMLRDQLLEADTEVKIHLEGDDFHSDDQLAMIKY
ncbi:UNVERIFIED_CONTAM: hypothetical protein RMT77_011052 [Armadillidium vulgare]